MSLPRLADAIVENHRTAFSTSAPRSGSSCFRHAICSETVVARLSSYSSFLSAYSLGIIAHRPIVHAEARVSSSPSSRTYRSAHARQHKPARREADDEARFALYARFSEAIQVYV
jgi:hypothetical protein